MVTVTAAEFKLISKALKRSLNEHEVEELGDEMNLLRAKYILSAAHENEKLIANLKKAGVWREDD